MSINTERLNSCFVDFEKVFDSISRKALLYRMRKTEISETMVSSMEIM